MKHTEIARSKYVESISVFPEGIYDEIDLTGLAAYTIHLFQENHVPTTFENIAVALFRQFPTKFCMLGYTEYPDAARVGRTLLQLGPKYRNWATGKVTSGFVLTESGREKVRQVGSILQGSVSADKQSRPLSQKSRPRTMDRSSQLDEIESSKLFKLWEDGQLESAEAFDVVGMLGAFAYTPPKAMRDRVTALITEANDFGRDLIVRFLTAVKKDFPEIFADK